MYGFSLLAANFIAGTVSEKHIVVVASRILARKSDDCLYAPYISLFGAYRQSSDLREVLAEGPARRSARS